jgi:hypothetical protein
MTNTDWPSTIYHMYSVSVDMPRRTEADDEENGTNDHETITDGGHVSGEDETRDPVKALLEDATSL